MLFDLGVSSMQLDEPARGFSFREDAPLDMRMAGSSAEEPSAADLVNGLSERELADVIFHYGDERRSRRIAAAIVREATHHHDRSACRCRRGCRGTASGGPPPRAPHVPGAPHRGQPGTRGARRVASARDGLLVPGGRVVVISYHSLEDGIVKRAFRDDPGLPGVDEEARCRDRRRASTRILVPEAPNCGPPNGSRRRREHRRP